MVNLYGPDGRFLYRGKRLGICSLCSSKDHTYDVGAMALTSRFCRSCIEKHGSVELRKDANHALQRAKTTTRIAAKQLREMDEKYAARFGAGSSIKWVFDTQKAE